MLRTCWAGWLFLAASLPVVAQSLSSLRPEWRRIGSSAVELDLPAPATGPVSRVWYSADGARLLALSASGRLFETADFDTWKETAAAAPPVDATVVSPRLPEPSARLRQSEGRAGRLYAVASSAWRSDDGGTTWSNLTSFKTQPLLGAGVKDLAVSPQNPDDIVVATASGVWRSLDGGLAWDGLNDSLPNLPARKLLALPLGSRGLRLSVDFGSGPQEVEWVPGEKRAWRTNDGSLVSADQAARSQWSAATGLRVTAVASAASLLYLGTADGWLVTSSDQGATWSRQRVAGSASVEGLFVDPSEPRTALAALSNRSSGRILRTTNAGLYWDDLTANLPPGRAHGVTADIRSGALYAATDGGVFYTQANLTAPAPATTWVSLSAALPAAPAADVSLDASGNQLYVALEGYGVFATLPPHRYRDLRLVSAADYRARAAAPGSLLSVLGARITAASFGDVIVPVLAAAETESQIQVPFEAVGTTLMLSLQSAAGASALGLPLRRASPAIFVDRDNTPLLLNADSGVLLDAMSPAHAGARIQILAAGLGGVKPVWPTGMPAPLENPPAVALPVHALLDRAPLEVTRATLAPGYVGFYLVEVQLPEIVNAGPAELYLEADGQESNRVRIWLAP
ncbi:MAG: hypothetical protein ABI693_31710 [Bryobacteraceae bacterium]